MRRAKRGGSDFPSGCAVNANAKEDTLTIRQNQKTPGEFPHCRGMGGRQLISASQLLSPGNACAPELSPLGESFLQSIRGTTPSRTIGFVLSGFPLTPSETPLLRSQGVSL